MEWFCFEATVLFAWLFSSWALLTSYNFTLLCGRKYPDLRGKRVLITQYSIYIRSLFSGKKTVSTNISTVILLINIQPSKRFCRILKYFLMQHGILTLFFIGCCLSVNTCLCNYSIHVSSLLTFFSYKWVFGYLHGRTNLHCSIIV